MKVAIIDPLGGYAGLHYFTDGMARGLQHAGGDVTVLTSAETPITGDEPYRVVVAYRGVYGKSAKWRRGLRLLGGTLHAVIRARALGCVVAHIHCFLYSYVEQVTAIAARLAGMKVVATFHDIESFGNKGSISGRRRLLHLVAGVILLNGFCHKTFLQVVGTDALQVKTFVIPAGNFIARFPVLADRATARGRLRLAVDKTVFLYFGNSRIEKGLDLLLNAMASFRDQPNILLVVAGKMKPEQECFYRDIATKAGVDDRVRFDIGWVSDEAAADYYTAADLVVAPYRRIYDSGVALMAMSFGRAILTSDLPPLTDLLKGGEYGLLFTSGDLHDLAGKMLWAAGHREELDEIGMQARAFVVRERNWDAVGNRLMAVYNQLMA